MERASPLIASHPYCGGMSGGTGLPAHVDSVGTRLEPMAPSTETPFTAEAYRRLTGACAW